MILTPELGARVVRDAHELIAGRTAAGELLAGVSDNPDTQRFLGTLSTTKLSATELMARQFYDLGHVGEVSSVGDRQAAAELGGLTLLLSDVIDDQIDNPEMPLDQKFDYMDLGIACLLNGRRPSNGELPASLPVQEGRASFDLAGHIHERIAKLDGQALFAPVIGSLVEDIKQQFLSTDLSEHLELTKRIGAGCSALASSAVRMIESVTDERVLNAANGVGSYAQCLDNAYELDDDLDEGAISYATLYLEKYGDTRQNRQHVVRSLLAVAESSIKEGGKGLSRGQQVIYGSAQLLIALKYRVFDRAHGVIKSGLSLSPKLKKPADA